MDTQSKMDLLGHGYPRPQLERANWTSLNGQWQFCIDTDALFKHPRLVDFDGPLITVPFAPESKASGIENTGFYKAVWYQREFDMPVISESERLVMHFGAVDWNARVWVNGQLAAEHDGGYSPFSADITDLLQPGKRQVVSVRGEDNPHDLEKNRGKQDWEERAHGIWYQRTTGIWQTVWMEVVSDKFLSSVDWYPSIQNWEIGFAAHIQGGAENLTIRIRLRKGDWLLADNNYVLTENEVRTATVRRKIELVDVKHRLELPDGAIDHIRNELLWHPDRPNIISVVIELRDDMGSVLDRCESYTQLTSVEVSGTRLLFNGHDELLRLALDQGYWQDSGMTPPDDAAIQRDIRLLKEAGFNGVRKHNKIEDPRFLYWADMLGLFVWEELPSSYRFTNKAMERSMRLWAETIERDRNHGCIIVWVPINESWGVPDLPVNELQRMYLRSMYRMTKILTGNGVVVGNDGWEMVESDIVAIHDYDADTNRIAWRYTDDEENIARLFRDERPGGRVLLLEDMQHQGKPKMLTEFGGIKLSKESGSWGYSEASSAEDLSSRYANLMSVVRKLPLFGGFCYTEFTDVYQEANGLFWMDRTPKFPLDEMRKATSGE